MTYLLIATYCLIAGVYIGECATERRHRNAIKFHGQNLDAARKIKAARIFVGNGMEVTQEATWTIGDDKFLIKMSAASEPA